MTKDIQDHYLVKQIYSDKKFMRSLELRKDLMRQTNLLKDFETESKKHLTLLMEFHDMAIERPTAAKEALAQLKSGELCKKDLSDLDELKRKLVEATSPVRREEANKMYNDKGKDFISNMSIFCIDVGGFVLRSIERSDRDRLSRDYRRAEPSSAASTPEKKSVSWAQSTKGGAVKE